MKFSFIVFSMFSFCVGISLEVFAQNNDQTAPDGFPNVNNPTKLMSQPGDTLSGTKNNVGPGFDQGVYIRENADSLNTGSKRSTNRKKKITSK